MSMKERFGRDGVWVRGPEATQEFAAGVEGTGYPVLWVGGSPPDGGCIPVYPLTDPQRLGTVRTLATHLTLR